MGATALVMDIGGTRSRLALARSAAGDLQLQSTTVEPTPEGSLSGVIADFLERTGRPPLSCVAAAVAGPVDAGSEARARMTNRALEISTQELRAVSGAPRALLLNDLAAVAAALPVLPNSSLVPIGPLRHARDGARVVIGVGTGIGVAALMADGTLVSGEGGHCESPLFDEVAQRLRGAGARSVEDMLAGSRLGEIYAAVTGQAAPVDADVVTTLAERGDAAAQSALRWHAQALGKVARDYVLTFGAWGGVYLTGGLIVHQARTFDAASFLAALADQPKFGARLATVPAACIVHPAPALLGLARLALAA